MTALLLVIISALMLIYENIATWYYCKCGIAHFGMTIWFQALFTAAIIVSAWAILFYFSNEHTAQAYAGTCLRLAQASMPYVVLFRPQPYSSAFIRLRQNHRHAAVNFTAVTAQMYRDRASADYTSIASALRLTIERQWFRHHTNSISPAINEPIINAYLKNIYYVRRRWAWR